MSHFKLYKSGWKVQGFI
ncbi:MAG: hypothetical protein ACJ0PA_05385 [Flavobacteriaceae bacterium]